jgi:hypothetical protein
MARYLTQEWLDRATAVFGSLPERPGANARIQRVVTGAPTGDVAWVEVVEDGRVVEQTLGSDDAAEVILTLPYDQARAIESGDGDLNLAYMRGRLKVAGSTGALLAFLPITQTPAYVAAQAELHGDTED